MFHSKTSFTVMESVFGIRLSNQQAAEIIWQKKKKNYKDVHPHPRGDECSINYVISPETLWENLSLSQMSDLSRRTPFLLLGKYLEQGDVCLTWLSLPDEINTRCHYSYLPKCSEESSQWWWQPWRQQLHCPCGVVSKWLKEQSFSNSFYGNKFILSSACGICPGRPVPILMSCSSHFLGKGDVVCHVINFANFDWLSADAKKDK